MKYKLTEKAKKMKAHEFAINYGVNIKKAVKGFAVGEVDVNDKSIVDSLKKDKMIMTEKIKEVNNGCNFSTTDSE